MSSRGLKRLATTLLVTVTVTVAISLLPVAGQAAGGDFYTPPATLGSGAPGELIRSEPMTAYGLPAVPLPARAWRVMYRSTAATGGPIAVTGTVLVPAARWNGSGARPVVGLAVGTQGLADRCAPSHQWAAGTEYESAVVTQMLLRGWAVAVTDYPGLGTPGDHTYVVGRTNGTAVLDSIRAARALAGTGLTASGPAAIYGYSEGGNSASWAIQLQPRYAPDVPLSGAAVGAVPADFPGLLEFHDGGAFAFLLLYAGIGFDAAYPELRLDDYLNERGRKARQAMDDTCVQDAIALGLTQPRHLADYTTSNPMTTPAWRRRLDENYLGTIVPRTPVLVGTGSSDEAIPYAQTRGLYERWCARGADAHFVRLPSVEHLLGGVTFALPAVPFLADRFAGKPLTRACKPVPPPTPTPTVSPTPSPQPVPQPGHVPDSTPPAAGPAADPAQGDLPTSVDAGLPGSPTPEADSPRRSAPLAKYTLGLLLAGCMCVAWLRRRSCD